MTGGETPQREYGTTHSSTVGRSGTVWVHTCSISYRYVVRIQHQLQLGNHVGQATEDQLGVEGVEVVVHLSGRPSASARPPLSLGHAHVVVHKLPQHQQRAARGTEMDAYIS